MSEDLSKAPEELEPEARRMASAPKKPLSEFLAEFEARLRDHPGEPATGAMQVVEDRAAGLRRSPAQAAPPPPPAPPTVVSDVPPAPEVEAIVDAAFEDAQPTDPAEAETAQPSDTDGGTGDASGESRRSRGRRRRKHRHRAH